MDAFLKEMGVGMAIRLVARNMSPRLTISENNGKWTLRTEMPIKNSTMTFTPGVLFEDKTPDGQEIKVSFPSRFAHDRLQTNGDSLFYLNTSCRKRSDSKMIDG